MKTATPARARPAAAPMPAPLAPRPAGAKLRAAFERLVLDIARESNTGQWREHAPGALLEIECDGQTYSLCRRHNHQIHGLVGLSPREREIVRMIAAGYPNKAIAAVLEISEWTVGTHVRRVFAKLRVSSRAAMVARWLDANDDAPEPGRAQTPAPPEFAESFSRDGRRLQNAAPSLRRP
jgi:DNA-binding CsgD family transcriptional regulator